MVSLKDYIKNSKMMSLSDFLLGIQSDKVYVRSYYRSFPKRK